MNLYYRKILDSFPRVTIKSIIFFLGFLLVIYPFLFNFFILRENNFLLDSVLLLNLPKYFLDLFNNGSIFFVGTYSTQQIIFFPIFIILLALQSIFSPFVSFFIFILVLYFLSYRSFLHFLLLFKKVEPSTLDYAITCFLGVLFYSSLSFFFYIQNGLTSYLPYLLLPLILNYSFKYLFEQNKKYLFYLLLSSFFLGSVNLTFIIIIICSLNIFYALSYKFSRLKISDFVKRVITLNLFLAPMLSFALGPFLINFLGGGNISSKLIQISEHFYSKNTNYINIITGRTDWAFFDGWKNIPYYSFASFYQNHYILALSFIPLILAVISLFNRRVRSEFGVLFYGLWIWLLFIFQMMLGLHNPVYSYLYNHIAEFQIFRNITKFAPLFYLVILMIIYLYVRAQKNQLVKKIILLFLVLAAFYNLPYWTNPKVFFKDRGIISIPQYWRDASFYINNNLNFSDKILVLPATYILDDYSWGEKNYGIRGSLFDVLTDVRTYRLSPVQIGDVNFQDDARQVFVDDTSYVRGQRIDFAQLSRLVSRYNFNFIAVTNDLLSVDYQTEQDTIDWLQASGYVKIKNFGQIDLYENAKLFKSILEGDDLSYIKKSNFAYDIVLKNINSARVIRFRESFHSGWEMSIRKNARLIDCRDWQQYPGTTIKECIKESVAKFDILNQQFFTKNIELANNKDPEEISNNWLINPEYLKNSLDKSYYTENADGSINIGLTLYFKPQLYFYFNLIVVGTMVLGCLGYLGWGSVRRWKRKDKQ